MIGRVAGRLLHRTSDTVLIDVRGVGYIVHVSDRVMTSLPRNGEAVALWTELQVREDGWTLFGFLTLAEKEWHRQMMTVQGVGAKVALALGAFGPEVLGRAVMIGDWATLARAKGVGPKTAQRVVNELRDRAPGIMAMAALGAGSGPVVVEDDAPVIDPAPAPTPARSGVAEAEAEALSALGNLGYAPFDAAQAVALAAEAEPGGDTAALIRGALKRLAPKG